MQMPKPITAFAWSRGICIALFATAILLQQQQISALRHRLQDVEKYTILGITGQDKLIAGWRDAFDGALNRIKDGIVVPAPNDIPIGDEWEIVITGRRKEQTREHTGDIRDRCKPDDKQDDTEERQ